MFFVFEYNVYDLNIHEPQSVGNRYFNAESKECSPICYNTYGRYHEHFRDHVMENCKKLSKTQKQHDREKHK